MGGLRRQHAEATGHLGIGVGQAAEIAAEDVLVELLAGLHVPEPAAVRADLVGDDEAHEVAVPDPADLDLEVDELDADAVKDAREEVVHPEREADDVVEVLLGDRKSTRLNSS